MKRICFPRPTRILAALATGLLLAISAISLAAQSAPASQPAQGFGPVYDAAHETILVGTIQEVVTRHTEGSPAGMHLLVAAAQGVVDTHLGPFLSKANQQALQTGMPVQIVGAKVTLNGKDYFLARQVTVGNQIITVRNARGFPVFQRPRGQRVKATGTAQAETKGDAQ
jgi:hypothetical protein